MAWIREVWSRKLISFFVLKLQSWKLFKMNFICHSENKQSVHQPSLKYILNKKISDFLGFSMYPR